VGALITLGGEGQWPAVTFGGDTYMVAYRDPSTNYRVMSAAISTTGVASSPVELHVTTFGTIGFPPDVAYDGTNFMVVWMRHIHPWNPGGAEGVWGRLVDTMGATVGAETKISDRHPVTAAVTILRNRVRVAFDGTNYLTVITADGDVYGQFVDPTGTPLFSPVSDSLTISNALDGQYLGVVGFVGDDFTTVFVDDRLAVPGLFEQRVSTAGALIGNTSFQNELLIAREESVETVAIAPAGREALVVWSAQGNVYATVVER
jgi:hypothetical protein